MRRWLPPIVALTVVASGLAASGWTDAAMTAARPHATASGQTESLDQKVDRFQREILSSINCEELALQPQLSDELARGWLRCALFSLYEARDLAGPLFEGRKAPASKENINDAIRLDGEAYNKIPLDAAKIRRALEFKRITVKIVNHRIVPRPKAADCDVQAEPSSELESFFKYEIRCQGKGKISEIELFPPPLTVPDPSLPPFYVAPNGQRQGCTGGTKARSAARYDAHEIDCRVRGETKDVSLQVKTTPPPQNGDQAVIGITTRNHRESIEIVTWHFGAQAQTRACTGSVQTVGANTYQLSNTCNFDTHSISWTLPATKSYNGHMEPSGQTGTLSSANGGFNNVLTLTPNSGVNPANGVVGAVVMTNQPLVGGDVTTSADGFTYMPPVS